MWMIANIGTLAEIGPSRRTPRWHGMTQMVDFDLDAVRQALPTRAGEIAVALLGEPNRGRSSRCELRFRRKGSLAVAIAGPKAGLWHDHELGISGDLIDLIQHTRRRDFLGALRSA